MTGYRSRELLAEEEVAHTIYATVGMSWRNEGPTYDE